MSIDRGCIYQKNIQFLDRSTGQPTDISTWEFEATIRNSDEEAELEMSTANGHFTVFDGENGWLRISLTEAETTGLTAGAVTFVLYRTDGGRRRIGRASEIVRDAE